MSAIDFAHNDINELEAVYDENAFIRLKDYLLKRVDPSLTENVQEDLDLIESGSREPEIYERLRSYLVSEN